MARDPGSVWAPLPEAGGPDGYRKDKFIVHSTGSNGTAQGTRNYFALSGVVNESTFIVGTGPTDPTLQIMDSTDNADANIAANQSGISVEVVGDGYGGYSAWQRSEIIRLGRWAAANHPIAHQIVPTPTGSGFGWHIMFGAPGPWTSVNKICPGPIRIQELKSDIFPAIFSGQTVPVTGGFLMSLSDVQQSEMYTWMKNLAAPLKVDDTQPARPRELVIRDIFINARNAAAMAAKAAAAGGVDEQAIVTALAPQVIAALGEAKGISVADVEAAVRKVFLDASTP